MNPYIEKYRKQTIDGYKTHLYYVQEKTESTKRNIENLTKLVAQLEKMEETAKRRICELENEKE